MIASVALQKAVYAALSGQISCPVHDEVPRTENAPYAVIGETASEVPWDTHDSEGSEEELVIHVWSRAEGSIEIKGIMAEIDDELHDADLELEVGQLVSLTRSFMTVFKEEVQPGETWRHGVLRYRSIISL